MRKLVVLFIISVLPLSAFADAVQIGNLWYNLDESTKTAEVTSSGGDEYSGDIVVPSTVTYGDVTYSVKTIGEGAFYDRNLQSVTIEEGIETIARQAFWDSDGIYELSLPSTLKTIGDEAFTWAYISTLDLPEGLVSVGQNAFTSCGRLKKVSLPSTLTEIGEYVFASCGSLSMIVSHIQTPFEISGNVFSSNSSATLYVPNGTKSIYEATAGWTMFAEIIDGEPLEATVDGLIYFYNTTSKTASVVGRANSELRSINIPSTIPVDGVDYNVMSVAKNAFNNCDMDSLTISSGVVTIGSSAFSNCYNIRKIELPSTITTIGDNAFQGCNSLQLAVLPSSLASIGDYAFWSCGNLGIVSSKIQTPFEISENVFALSSDGSYNDAGEYVTIYTPSSATLYVPDGTKNTYESTIGWKGMFADIVEGELKEAVVDGLTYSYVEGKGIATVTGRANDELSNIIIPGTVPIGDTNYSVKTVGAGAFQSCYIDTLVIQDGVETIEKHAFSDNWGNLKTVTLPASLRTIGDYAFSYSTGFKKLIIPQGVTTIGNNAFEYCNGLLRLELPSTLTSIGEYAFFRCSSLSAVISKISSPLDIESSVFASDWSSSEDGVTIWPKSSATLYVPDGTSSAYKAIAGWNMFADIVEGELKEVTVDGLTYSYVEGKGTATVIGRANEELRNITIPGSVSIGETNYLVKSVSAGAFQNCGIDTLVIQEGVETISKNAFRENWGNLRSVTLPTSLRTIGESAFYYCYGIRDLIIPNGVTEIGKEAFRECYEISKIELPSTLTTIGDYAFYPTRGLSSVVSRIQTPFEIPQNVFATSESGSYNDAGDYINTYTPSSATLYVPDGTKTAYQTIEGWNMFDDIIEGELKEAKVGVLNYSYIEGKGTATVIYGDYTELTEVTIPGSVEIDGTLYSVKTIGNSAFQLCEYNLNTVTIESGVETIGKYAFRWCRNLKNINLPSSLRNIDNYAFDYCSNLSNVEIPEGVTSIGEYAFEGLNDWSSSSLSVVLPSTLTSIGNHAFQGAGNFSSVTSRIQNPFEISELVFGSTTWNSDKQKEDTIPSKANLYVPEGTMAKYQAIKGWTMFAGIYEGELKEAQVDSLKYAYLQSSKTATVVSGEYREYTAITIPSTVTIDETVYQVKEIGANAFRDCYNLNNVTISEGIETIGKEAFQWCSNAVFGTLPSSIRVISGNAFWDCDRIEKLVIPEGVQTLGDAAFGACSGLQKVTLPNTLISIGERAFESCSNLTTVISHIQTPFEIHQNVFGSYYKEEWDEENSRWVQYYNPSPAILCVPIGTMDKYKALQGWLMFSDFIEGELLEITYGDLAYIVNPASKTATVTKGGNYSDLTKVTIPGSFMYDGVDYQVTGIGARAFANIYITSATIGDGVETIGQEAFASCQQLATVTLPSSLTTLNDAVFRECSRLGSVVIPSGLSSLGYSVFAGCKSLKSLDVAEGNEKYESRGSNAVIERSSNTLVQGCNTTVIPSSVTAIGKEAFIYLDLKEITIPSTVKSIGENAFNSCNELKEIVLPEGLETLSNTAFHSCGGLTLVELPNSLKSIGGWVFAYCNSLQNVVSNIENPKDIDYNTFGENNEVYNRATLWVPRGKVRTYQALEGWSRFELFDELLRDTLISPTITYNGRYMSMANDTTQRAQIYYSVDGSAPTILYSDTIAISNLGVIQAISKRFGSYTVDTTRYEVTYVYDGVTARTASGGLLKNAFEWCGTDNIEMLDIDGTLNDDDFGTIRSLSKLTTLNMAASKMENSAIPAGAFADMKLQWYVSPYTMTSVGSNIFRGCSKLSAITWNSVSVELPEDVVTDVANPNMLVYAKAQAMIPYALKNVIVNGVANNIILADSAGNNNFNCPVEFLARRITYTHDYQQPTARGITQGWETLALPFTVSKITHEKQGELTPIAVEGAAKPFWLYELGDNGLEASTQIRANVPYLICMPNDDAYGDNYILGGRVTFSATNVTITTSGGTTVSQGDRQFVPTYQSVAQSEDVYALNVGEAYSGNPMGSVFVPNYREVRPFEAYSVHANNRSRIISLSSLGGGDTTGFNDLKQKNDGEAIDTVVNVYSLSGALIKQGKREEVLRSLSKGLYIINGKKVIK